MQKKYCDKFFASKVSAENKYCSEFKRNKISGKTCMYYKILEGGKLQSKKELTLELITAI